MGSAEIAAEVQRYRTSTPGSAALFAAAQRSLPGGDSRSTLHYPPHPLAMARGAGSRVWDVDGHELVDLTNNHTALVHGNANPVVLDAVREQMALGTCFSGPVPLQVEVADRLTDRLPGLEQVRFCASGTEATLHATRAARAFTGRLHIAKAEGAYHGSQDDVFVSTHPRPDQAGPPERPTPVPRAEGLHRSAIADTVVFPFNDLDATAAVLREAGPDLAAVLVEPVMGSAGMIPAEPGYLVGVADVAAEVGALFVVDEVITLRLAPGGGQAWAGVEADLSCFGKMLGGGFPLGAFGGRAEVLAAFDPTGEAGPVVGHPGSMNAWAVGLAAAARHPRPAHPGGDRGAGSARLGSPLAPGRGRGGAGRAPDGDGRRLPARPAPDARSRAELPGHMGRGPRARPRRLPRSHQRGRAHRPPWCGLPLHRHHRRRPRPRGGGVRPGAGPPRLTPAVGWDRWQGWGRVWFGSA